MLRTKMNSLLNRIKARYWRGEEDSKTYSRIFHLTWPAFIELLLVSMLGMADTVMVGQLSKEALSGVGLTSQPLNLLIAIFAAVNIGTTTLVAWSVGAGDRKRPAFITRQAITMNVVLGLFMMVIGVLGTPYIVNFMGKDQEAIRLGVQYMYIICWSLPFQAVTMCITAALRGCGQTRLPMLYNLGANVVNVILNYGMIYGKLGFPVMGVEGAALATSISRVLSCAAALGILILWKNAPFRLRVRESWRPHWKTMKEMFVIGLPAAGEQFVTQTGLMMYQKIIAGLGTADHAAHQIAATINGMAWSISQAFSVCTSALVGQSIGANNPDEAERYTMFTRRLARVFTAAIAILFIIFARPIVMLFAKDTEVIDIAVPIFWFVAIVQYVQSALMCTTGALRGAGDTMYPLYATILGIYVFRIALAFFFANVCGFGLAGAWLSFFIDQTVRLIFINRRFKSGKWRGMGLAKNKKNRSTDDELAV